MTVTFHPYKLERDRNVYWGKREDGRKTHIKRNYNYIRESGTPFDIVVEGKGTNVDLVDENRETQQEDSEISDLCMDYFQKGEMNERRKHKGISFKDKMMLMLVIVALGASIFALATSLRFSYQILPEFSNTLKENLNSVMEDKLGSSQLVSPSGTPSNSDLVMPT